MFISVQRKNIVKSLALILTLVTVSVMLSLNLGAVKETVAPTRLTPIYGVDTQEKKIAISFDAAWGADKTQGIIDILKKFNADATFFLVGFWIEKYPDMVKKIYEEGFQIGNHSQNHLKMSNISQAEMEKEIVSVNEAVEKLTGFKPILFRPPYGDYDNVLCSTVSGLNMYAIQWSVDSLDWKGISGKQIADRVINGVKPGSIILCHNNSEHILEALPIILMSLQNKGYTFVSIDELIYKDNYYIDSQGTQRLKQDNTSVE